MGLLRLISEQRQNTVLGHARRHLEDGEDITHWVRTKEPKGGRSGIVYLTQKRVVVHWSGGSEDDSLIWTEVSSWGVDDSESSGPILAIESDGKLCHEVKMPVQTRGQVSTVNDFLREFAELAPWPKRNLTSGNGTLKPRNDVQVSRMHRTLAARTMRIIKTVTAGLMIVAGILLIPVPGPWSLFINLGALAILASEYDWAEDTLEWTKDRYQQAKKKFKKKQAE